MGFRIFLQGQPTKEPVSVYYETQQGGIYYDHNTDTFIQHATENVHYQKQQGVANLINGTRSTVIEIPIYPDTIPRQFCVVLTDSSPNVKIINPISTFV
ncbi:MAG: hypothetical protein OXI23_05440, partial [Gemmatimonadota bacterium]|nr:hypothetical protein [Gemmatimonadota bacterium]